MGCEDAERTDLARGRDKLPVVVNLVINMLVP